MAYPRSPSSILRRFLNHSASGGIVLMVVAALALVVANSGLAEDYEHILHREVAGLSVLHWINDGLMALFFLLVGLEIKREFVEGQLATWGARVLPGFAALGGMAVPAAIFLALNAGPDGHPHGWAIPSATDIAFALGVLSLLGNRVPLSLRVFLTALAILDDLGAVLIIAVFYTTDLDFAALTGAAAVLAVLVVLNILKVRALSPYLLLGAALWYLVLRSGVHATLAGVALALTIPLRGGHGGLEHPPLHRLESGIQPFVTFLIVPLFGFANAGVSFAGITAEAILSPVPIGVAAGLFLGKQAGVALATWLAVKLRWAGFPEGATWRQFYGVAVLCGIGFTMSLFIGLLAYDGEPLLQDEVKIGVLIGSLASAILGAIIIMTAGRRQQA